MRHRADTGADKKSLLFVLRMTRATGLTSVPAIPDIPRIADICPHEASYWEGQEHYAIPFHYINNLSLDATQIPITNKHKSLPILRLHRHLQNYPTIYTLYQDLRHGISYQFLRFQAS